MKRIFGPALVLISTGVALLIFCLFVFHATKHQKQIKHEVVKTPQIVKPAPPPPPPQYVIGLSHNLAAGTIINSSDLMSIPVPSGKYPKNQIPYSAESNKYFIGSVLKQTALADSPLETSQVINPGSAGFLAAALPTGYQALTLPISPDDDQSGLVYPGDRLDIILLQKLDASSTGQSYVSETLIHNALVIAVGDKLTPVLNESGYAMPTKMITLALTPIMAKTLLLAVHAGQISYTVLSNKDENSKALTESIRQPVYFNQISPYGTDDHKITIFTPSGGQQDTAP